MICEKCGGKSQVLDSRAGEYIPGRKQTDDKINVCRRRRCKTCGYCWQTIELRLGLAKEKDYAMQNKKLKEKLGKVLQLWFEVEQIMKE